MSNDTIIGTSGDDTITTGEGNDSVRGEAGNDFIDTSNYVDPGYDAQYWPYYLADPDPNDDKDTVFGGDGDDTIYTGDDADYISGGEGADYIDAGIDNDRVFGDGGNDVIIGWAGNDTIDGGTGDDTIYGDGTPDNPIPYEGTNSPGPDSEANNNKDLIHGGDGNDVIFGGDDSDTIYGDAGNDYLDGGLDGDYISGGAGNDTIVGDGNNDYLYGEDGSDRFILDYSGYVANLTVDGGTGGTDFDTLDYSDFLKNGWVVNNMTQNPSGDGTGWSGQIVLYNPSTGQYFNFNYNDIENFAPCFTPGTMIATPKGERPVEELRAGDKVITRDNGIQEIRWAGRRDLSGAELARKTALKPVLIRAGSLGGGLPETDLLVSPNHRMLVANARTALYFEEHEVLVAAKHLINGRDIVATDPDGVSYVHFMFEQHEVVLANGAWSESFQPGDQALMGLGKEQQAEIFQIFPELREARGREAYQAARQTLKRREAHVLLAG